MKITTKIYNTLPSKKDAFWQLVLIPTVSIVRSIDRRDDYTAVNIEWLFWSVITIFQK
jgi:hypothetical protein